MEYLLLVCAVFIGAIKAILNRKVKSGTATAFATFRLNLICFVLAFITVFFMGLGDIATLFKVPLWLALATAIATVGMQVCMMKAVQTGPVSLSSLFTYCGFIIPTLFGSLYYRENFHILQGVGIALILCAFVLSLQKEKQAKFNLQWLLYALGAMLFSGLLGVFQKIFVKEYPNNSLNNFLTVSFFIVVLLVGVCTLFCFFKERGKTTISRGLGMPIGVFLAYTIPLGVIIGGLNLLNTYLSSVLPSVVVFPAINGGAIFLTTAFSAVIFKEKPTKRQTLALIIGIGAILLIALSQLL